MLNPEQHLHRKLAQYFLKRSPWWTLEKSLMEDLRAYYTKRTEKGFESPISTSERYGERIPEVRRILKHWYAVGAIESRGNRRDGFWLRVNSEGYLREVVRIANAESRRYARKTNLERVSRFDTALARFVAFAQNICDGSSDNLPQRMLSCKYGRRYVRVVPGYGFVDRNGDILCARSKWTKTRCGNIYAPATYESAYLRIAGKSNSPK